MYQNTTYTVEEAIKKLEYYCAYQERCHKEVRQKLLGMRMIPEAIDHIMVHLIEQNFLNETRYAKAFVQGKFRIKQWGKRRLTLELMKKDISKSLIHEVINDIHDNDYHQTLHNLAQKALAGITEKNRLKKKKKLSDYLLYRGWEPHLVYEKVNALIT
ncbi:regulatory protein RecX [Aestuariivivens sediminis]|uniref:regulatory protein RecX n=1 Tax=Aestuariivivens sediminis TaxID=2913557 RepID=UPI001F5AA748|nr:regulatory protein RecX [Aestuariivivens sediminis]